MSKPKEPHKPEAEKPQEDSWQLRIARELTTIRQLLSHISNDMRNAEAEIPEKMRRFITYMHDLHDIAYMYEERGLPVPTHVLREMERCDDRCRQVMHAEHSDDGTFGKIRREMADDPNNRWDHTKFLPPPTKEPK